ncbi:hypothetical protein EW145_g2777 [Phellinidium pouzarii]|uniref:DNA 3'-5' helicase n=1 Tax=Phellinidium pouzarii TaxID=167371 RepID=A0A4V3XD50_9AGAM|nr:hypothetical protein EW145_g2777 [Phellinidium pouzarii]
MTALPRKLLKQPQDALVPAGTRQQAEAIQPQAYDQSFLINDDIDVYNSSDSHGYDTSSPTPSNPRNNSGGFQQMLGRRISQPPSYCIPEHQMRTENNKAGYAYMHGVGPRSTPSAPQSGARDSDPRNAHRLRLRPVSDLPDIYRGIFKFGVFNAVQSKCFNAIMHTKENMVVSAPTGSGKTVLFELALIEMLTASSHQPSYKSVYVAPTKALCSERMRDWTAKFEPLGCEMTGDTVATGKSAWNAARSAKLIITTVKALSISGEQDHGEFLSEIKLFLVDEVHILNESRGSTLEVVVSRMKARGLDIRFVLVSATVPNIRDIANWIGNPSINPEASATVFEFGEEYRPCKITRHVYGYPRKNQNDFQFARTLDFKLYSVLQQHSCGKPILIFCNTRKGVLTTAEQLLKEYEQAVAGRQNVPWTQPKQLSRTFHDKRLEKLAKAGVGVHHAGLSLDDRRHIESLFLEGSLRVVTATSTLAVGVNLPAHTVVIKGVKLYQNNAWQEYSDLDVVQMIGRAGRPQFDKEGVAIILCEQDLEYKYRNLAQGKTILESSLHQNLSEHINSEIGIGTINNIQTAKKWLRKSFLRQRIQKNPGHYNIGKFAGQTWEEKLDDMVLQSIKKLKESELVAIEGEEEIAELSVTEYGEIMSKYYVRQTTMGSILKLPERSSAREILEIISGVEELGDVRLRGGDKQVYNKMRDHPGIRYKIKKVEKASDKAFLLIQAVLGGISLSAPEYKTSDSQPTLDALLIFRHTARIARVVVEVAIVKKNGAQLKHGLELLRCLTAKAWEDRPVVLKQIESIGEKSLKVLAEHGITSLQALRKQAPARIEMLLNRRQPFGHEVLAFVQTLPQYDLSIKVDDITSYNAKKPVSVELTIECRILETLAGKANQKQRTRSPGMTSILTTTSDLKFIDFRRISTKALQDSRSFSVIAELSKPSQSVCVLISSENFAGLTVTQTYKPSISSREYPTVDTQPKTSEELLLDGLEDDPDFWNNNLDEDSNTETKINAIDSSDTRAPSKISGSTGSSFLLSDALDETLVGISYEHKKLSNGNFSCNHNCKDKAKCRHLCCREGTAKPSTMSKKQLDEVKKGEKYSTASEPRKKTASKIEIKDDARLGQLESLHKRVGVNDSLRLPEGRRIKLDDNKFKSSHKPKQNKLIDFDMDFADIRNEGDIEFESVDDMPNSKELLAATQRNSQAKNRQSSEAGYSDSELDAIMLTVDTEIASISKAGAEKKSQYPSHQNDDDAKISNKRGIQHINNTQNSTPTTIFSEPAAKKFKIDSDQQTPSDDGPLFLHNSFSSQRKPENSDADLSDDFHDEDNFSLDETLFKIIPSDKASSNVQTADSRISPINDTFIHSHKQGPLEECSMDMTRVEHNRGDRCDKVGEDDWAELLDWLENSGSVKIVESVETDNS